jgi:hypothetical protein
MATRPAPRDPNFPEKFYILHTDSRRAGQVPEGDTLRPRQARGYLPAYRFCNNQTHATGHRIPDAIVINFSKRMAKASLATFMDQEESPETANEPELCLFDATLGVPAQCLWGTSSTSPSTQGFSSAGPRLVPLGRRCTAASASLIGLHFPCS